MAAIAAEGVPPKNKRKRVTLTLQQRGEVLAALVKGEKRAVVAKQFHCSEATISRIVDDEELIRARLAACKNYGRSMRERQGSYEEVDAAVAIWFGQARASGVSITDAILQEKGLEFASALGVSGFAASGGWVSRWKKREGIAYRKLTGERRDADKDSADQWVELAFPEYLQRYDAKDVFNADETALYIKALPCGTLARAGEEVSGGKTQKQRITVLLMCNMTGTEKRVLTIGTSKKKNRIALRATPHLSRMWRISKPG